MAPSSDLRSRVDSFVSELEVLIRKSALEAVVAALRGAAPKTRGPGRPLKARASKRLRRDPQAMLELAARVHTAIKASPGQSAEQLGASLRMPTKALALPIRKLLADKVVTTTGQRRGTKYYAAGAKSSAGAKPARTRRSAPKPAKSPAAKPTAKKRKPMSAEQNAALVERMAKARAARASPDSKPGAVQQPAPRDYVGERIAKMRAVRTAERAAT